MIRTGPTAMRGAVDAGHEKGGKAEACRLFQPHQKW
jgi:hypothetical protein